MDKFNNKYRIPSARLQNWGFGLNSNSNSNSNSNCRDAIHRVSTIGIAVNKIAVNKTTDDRIVNDKIVNDTTGGVTGNKNPMLHQNISRIIRWYKGRYSFEMRKIHADFAWQSRFHEPIIRDAQSFENIQNYIVNNPLNWNKDKFHG